MKKYNTKRNHLKKNSVTRKHRGGKKRVEKVRVVFSRQYTNPDIFSMVRVEKGPQSNDTGSQGEYLVNFVSETAKDFEEELARILKGPPESQEKEKVYEFVFKDSDVALEPGADTPIKCKKSKKSTQKKRGGGQKGGFFDFLMGAQRLRGQKYEHWLEERLIAKFNDVDFVNKVRVKFGYDKTNLQGRGQFTKDMMVKDVCSRDPKEKALIAPNLRCPPKTI